jgi:hypothetical protein
MDEITKAAVQAHCLILAPKWKDGHWLAHGVRLWRYFDQSGWNIDRHVGDNVYTIVRLENLLQADNNQWWIAAKLLGIPTT